jgi:voltage-gated potassium channel
MASDPGIVVLALLIGVAFVGWLIDRFPDGGAATRDPADRTDVRMTSPISRMGADEGSGFHGAEQPRERLTSEAPAVEAAALDQEATKPTPRQIAERKRTERVKVFKRDPKDGPVVARVRWFAGIRLLHFWIERFIVQDLVRRQVAGKPTPGADASDEFRTSVERYWLSWTYALVAVSAIAALLPYLISIASGPVQQALKLAVGLAAIVSIFRLVEIASTSVRLHILKPYKTSAPQHAILLVFVAFFQVALAFASLYLCESYWRGDGFGLTAGEWPLLRWLDMIYFSLITLSTIGLGDVHPVGHWGKLIVMFEVFFSLLLLLVVFQRSTSGYDPDDDKPDKPGPASNTGHNITGNAGPGLRE